MIVRIKNIIMALKLFNNWPECLIDTLAKKAEIIQLGEGQNLSDFIEDFNDIFIIESGYLELSQQQAHQNRTIIYRTFDMICYKSLFESHGKDIEINAFKSTIIIKIRHRDLLKTLTNYPQLAFELAWYFSNPQHSAKRQKNKNCLTISLIPAGTTPDVSSFADKLQQSLSFTGKSIHLNSRMIKKIVADKFHQPLWGNY